MGDTRTKIKELSIEEHNTDEGAVDGNTLAPLTKLLSLRRLTLRFRSGAISGDVLDAAILPLLRDSLELGHLTIHGIKWEADKLRRVVKALEQSKLKSLSFGIVESDFSTSGLRDLLRTRGTCLEEIHFLRNGVCCIRGEHYEYFGLDVRSSQIQAARDDLELKYFCALNRAGRKVFRRADTSKEDMVRLLARQVDSVSKAKSDEDGIASFAVLYGLLREVPHLLTQQCS